MLRSETAANPARRATALAGLRRYQEAARPPPPPPMPVVAERHGAVLRDYGGAGPTVVFVPSLINPARVLDLDGERSLLRWLAARGHHVLLIDWGERIDARRALSIAGHVEEIAAPLIDEIGESPALVGYCLGGTMAIATASLISARSVATLAAPWFFAGFPVDARARLDALWRASAGSVAALGALPMEIVQSAFWSLDPVRTIAKYEAFAALPDGPEADAFVTLEDWANDGPPLPVPAARELFESFVRDDATGTSAWSVAGRTIDPAALPCPLLNFVSMTDRIVPAASAIRAGERIAIDHGHVGMVVGGGAREALWEPLDAWLSRSATS